MNGSLATITDHTIHTENDSSSAGIDIHRLRRAMRSTFGLPESRVLRSPVGQHYGMARLARVAPAVDILHFGEVRQVASSAVPVAARSMLRIETCIQIIETATTRNSSMKLLVQTPVRSISAPKAIGSTNPPRPPIMPTRPPTAPTFFGVIDRDMLVHGRLAQLHEEAEHENQHDEGWQAHARCEADRPVDTAHDVLGGRVGQQEASQQ